MPVRKNQLLISASALLLAGLFLSAIGVQGIDLLVPLHSPIAQSAGGAIRSGVAPDDALLGAAVVGISEMPGDILKQGFIRVLTTGILVSTAALLLYVFQVDAG